MDDRPENCTDETIYTDGKTVLFIDDEPFILDIGKQVLEMLGYRVFPAASGEEAVAAFKEKTSQIDVVVLDMTMPEMGGSETFDALKAIEPDVRVILASGYSMADEAEALMKAGCRGFMQKPFSPGELSAKIREALL